MGGRIVGVRILAVLDYAMRFLAQDLHSTKGWQTPYPVSREWLPAAPVLGKYYGDGRSVKRLGLTCDGSRLQLNRDLVQVRPEKIKLERHGWYRRQQRKEAARASA